MKRLASVLPIALLVAATPLLTGCAVTIEPGERAIKKTMGIVSPDILQPGFVLFNPFSDDIITYSIQQETVEGQAHPLTSDQQPITIQYKVLYRTPEKQLLNLYQNYKGDPFETLVAPQIQEAFRQVVAQHKAEGVTQNVGSIKDKVLAIVATNVKGLIQVVDIPITHVELPEELQKSIMEKQKMEIESKKKAFELDREQKQAEITVTKARAEAESMRLQSLALQKSPELVKYRALDIELEKAKKWDGKLPTTVLGANANTLFSLK